MTPSLKHLEKARELIRENLHGVSPDNECVLPFKESIAQALDQAQLETLQKIFKEVEKLWVEGKFNTEELCKLRSYTKKTL